MAKELAIGSKESLQSLLRGSAASIASVAAKHLSPERLMKLALLASSRNQKLLDCSPRSFIAALADAATMGLEPNTPHGHAFLVPVKNGKTGEVECQLRISARGLMELARRSGVVVSIEARVVHAKDGWKRIEGLAPVLEHVPSDAVDPGEMVRVYAIARLKDGFPQYEVMSRAQVDAIMRRAPGHESGPWRTDYEEMARKTVVRRLCKYLPQGDDLAKALEEDDEAATAGGEITNVLAGPVSPLEGFALSDYKPMSRAEELKIKLEEKREAAQREPGSDDEEGVQP